MPELIVVEKIDGNPVAWRCSVCRQNFSARGKFTPLVRHTKVTGEFKLHLELSHKTVNGMAYAANGTGAV